MDKHSRAHHHKELLNNPLFQELNTWIADQITLANDSISIAPSSDANAGWFANREQLIGAKTQTEQVALFIQQLPETQEE